MLSFSCLFVNYFWLTHFCEAIEMLKTPQNQEPIHEGHLEVTKHQCRVRNAKYSICRGHIKDHEGSN